MASLARGIHCKHRARRRIRRKSKEVPVVQVPVPKIKTGDLAKTEKGKKNLVQPRLCSLRSYGEDRFGVVKSRKDETTPFSETLPEYIDSSNRSRGFDIIPGRLAMIVFAATVTTELVTGNFVFSQMDSQGIAEAVGVCLGAATSAVIFTLFSSSRARLGHIFTIRCNQFMDSFIDDIMDFLFNEKELSDWSDDK